MTDKPLKIVIEAVLFAANYPLAIDQLQVLFPEDEQPKRAEIRAVLAELQADYIERGIELVEVASGYRFQSRQAFSPWIKRLYAQRPPRYSRALLETLALIAYRQPITRSEIESIRGVSVSSNILKNLKDYQWVRVIGHRESPGRPALYGTTRLFLDHFNLKNLEALPTLAELREMKDLYAEGFEADEVETSDEEGESNES